MKKASTCTFTVGDHVAWNSEAGRVAGTITAVHRKNVAWKGYTHHASPEHRNTKSKVTKSDHIALHKGSALKLVRPR